MPTAYGLGGADRFIIPLAMAMAWGLVSGTILTLIWIPCAYAISEDMIRFTNEKILKRKSPEKKSKDATIQWKLELQQPVV